MIVAKRGCMRKTFPLALVLVICLLLVLHFYLLPIVSGAYNHECLLNTDNHRNLRYAVKVICKTMEKYNITYWLDYGTLLGAVQYNDVLPWDGDADISFLLKDDKVSFHTELFEKYEIMSNDLHAYYKGQSIDYMRWTNTTGKWDGKDVTLLHKHYPASILREENVFILHYHELESFPLSWVKPRTTVDFHGVQLSIPNNPHEFLRNRYSFTYPFGLSVPYKWKCWVPCWLRKANGC